MTLSIRPANLDDAALASRLIYLSMNELADYLFGGVNLTVSEILSGLFSASGNRFSFEISDIAECDGEEVGLLVSFPGWEMSRRNIRTGVGLFKLYGLANFRKLFMRALSIAEGEESRRDEYYLANMAVSTEFQGRGIGSGLLAHAEQKAKDIGLKKCSLVVDMQNASARRLYERFGYHVVYTKTYPGQAEDAHAGYHRMVKELV